jgi:hypothetical protein
MGLSPVRGSTKPWHGRISDAAQDVDVEVDPRRARGTDQIKNRSERELLDVVARNCAADDNAVVGEFKLQRRDSPSWRWHQISPLSCGQVSFKGAKQAVTAFAPKIEAARPKDRPALIDAMLAVIAYHRVGNRPGRWEPRATKRRPRHGARLNQTRAEAKLAHNRVKWN